MGLIRNEDFDADNLPSPFDADLYARFRGNETLPRVPEACKLTGDEELAVRHRLNYAAGQPEVVVYEDTELDDLLKPLAHQFFYDENYADPEPIFEAQYREHYTLARWMQALANVGRMLRGA